MKEPSINEREAGLRGEEVDKEMQKLSRTRNGMKGENKENNKNHVVCMCVCVEGGGGQKSDSVWFRRRELIKSNKIHFADAGFEESIACVWLRPLGGRGGGEERRGEGGMEEKRGIWGHLEERRGKEGIK